jgi:branched-chain amino acid transport system permease protein
MAEGVLAVSATRVIQTAVDAVSLGSLYALVALGIALIFGIMRLVNLAHGELIMFGGYTVFLLGGAPWPVLIVATVTAAALLALGMERIAFRPVRDASPATLMVTSFAVAFVLQNLAVVVMGVQTKSVNLSGIVTESFSLGGLRIAKLSLITLGTTLVLLLLLLLFLKRTSLGLQMRAAAEDFRMARLLGVRANVVIAAAFAISGGLAGVVAILLVAQTGTASPTMGVAPLIVGIVAVVIGGIYSLGGAVLGGFILGSLTIGLQASLPLGLRPFRDAIVFSIVIGILLLRPQGIVSARTPTPV